MKPHFAPVLAGALLGWGLLLPTCTEAQTVRLVSQRGLLHPAPTGGNGDSSAAIVSRDGRFVLFASVANNLAPVTTNVASPPALIPAANVFLRNRAADTTTLVSVNADGTGGGNADSLPVDVSADGRYVLFESLAGNLVPGDTNNVMDIFIRDLVAGTTSLVSTGINGVVGNGPSRSATMTPDGRYVAFVSTSTNLVSDDTNGISDVFVRDVQSGSTVQASAGAQRRSIMTLAGSEAPQITPDGRYVAFYSAATNLVPLVPAGGDIYVRDLVNGTTVWASAGARGAAGAPANSPNLVSYNHRLSNDGQFVAYEVSTNFNSTPGNNGVILRYSVPNAATEIVHTNAAVAVAPYDDIRSLDISPDGRVVAFVANRTNAAPQSRTNTCILAWEAQTGAITLVSADIDGQAPTRGICDWPAVNASGRYVAFLSSATNLVTKAIPAGYHVYVRDLQDGVTTLADLGADGPRAALDAATVPQICDDGSRVSFWSPDSTLVSTDRNRSDDVFCFDLGTGGVELVSEHDSALATLSPNGPSALGIGSVSSDGRFIAFSSDANNIAGIDTNGYRDVFAQDLATGASMLVSAGTNGWSGNGPSTDAAMSPDGGFVAFSTLATDMVPGDANNNQDVFLRDLQAGTNLLVSIDLNNNSGANGASYLPLVSRGGRYVLFRSRASNLAQGAYSTTYENLFVRDMAARRNYGLTTSGAGPAAMTPDGRYVVYAAGNLASWQLFAWDVQAAARVFTNVGTSYVIQAVAISDDGRRVAYAAASSSSSGILYAADLSSGSRTILEPLGSATYAGLRLNSDGRFLVYSKKPTSGLSQVYVCDLLAGTNKLVSRTYIAGTNSNARSDSPVISADGRFIAFRSYASDIVSAETNGLANIFLFDQLNDRNVLLSSGTPGPNNSSTMPLFSGDGQTLFFQSLAANLAASDYNHGSDIFSYRFLFVALHPDNASGKGPWLSWSWEPGRNYQVDFRSLNDFSWQPLSGSFTNDGVRAWQLDSAPDSDGRLYRVHSY